MPPDDDDDFDSSPAADFIFESRALLLRRHILLLAVLQRQDRNSYSFSTKSTYRNSGTAVSGFTQSIPDDEFRTDDDRICRRRRRLRSSR